MAKVEEIDILQMELDKKLPHWLDPYERDPQMVEDIRERNRAKWAAEQKTKGRQKRWQRIRARSDALLSSIPSIVGQDGLYEGRLWDEGKHPRVPPGQPGGGQFTSGVDRRRGKEGRAIEPCP